MSKNLNCLFVTGLVFILSSCSVTMMIPENLKSDTTVMEVKGRSGGIASNRLSFGDYKSTKVNRGVKATSDKKFAMTFKGTTEQMHFDLYDEKGHSSKVFCITQNTKAELPIMGEHFRIAVGEDDTCAGTISLDSSIVNGEPVWNFKLFNSSMELAFKKDTKGTITNGEKTIFIRVISHNSKGKTMNDGMALGFEFVLDGEAIGAVEVIGGGRILIKNSLPDYLKFLIATTAVTMLTRFDMGSLNT